MVDAHNLYRRVSAKSGYASAHFSLALPGAALRPIASCSWASNNPYTNSGHYGHYSQTNTYRQNVQQPPQPPQQQQPAAKARVPKSACDVAGLSAAILCIKPIRWPRAFARQPRARQLAGNLSGTWLKLGCHAIYDASPYARYNRVDLRAFVPISERILRHQWSGSRRHWGCASGLDDWICTADDSKWTPIRHYQCRGKLRREIRARMEPSCLTRRRPVEHKPLLPLCSLMHLLRLTTRPSAQLRALRSALEILGTRDPHRQMQRMPSLLVSPRIEMMAPRHYLQ